MADAAAQPAMNYGLSQTTQQPKPRTDEITTKVLNFFSNASNEVLIACAVGASAVLYMVLGRLGLLLIGVIGGIALHATWERQQGIQQYSDGRSSRRREPGLEVARRLLDWKDTRRKQEDEDIDTKTEVALKAASGKELDFSEYPPETASALKHLVDAVIRDYVKYWYQPILPGELSFPSAARQTLTGFVLALCGHQARKRPADALLAFFTNATSIVIVFLSELAKGLMAPDALELEASEALNLYLDRADSNLANMASREEQDRKLLSVADDFLQSFLDPKTYNCEPARLFLRQMFAGVVLQSVLNSISQPEWINGWIIYLLEEGETELISAIDAGVEKAATRAQGSMSGQTQATPVVDDNGADTRVSEENNEPSNLDDDASLKRFSRAGDAMQAAMEEAQRLTAMIQAEEEKKADLQDTPSSAFTTNTQVTPTSSQDDISASGRSYLAASLDSSEQPLEKDASAISSTPAHQQFTSFDQITPAYRPVPEPAKTVTVPPLTLHNVKITIFDDAMPGEKSLLKSKPQTEYLLQIEPASALLSGWMVPRKYSDIEPLHEYLYKIANVSGAPAFARRYQQLPTYKGKTKDAFRYDLEKYLHDALSYEPLAESEGMKKFLDKDQGFQKSGAKNPLAFAAPVGDAFQTVGKGMLGGFSTATKGITTGGQAVFDGVGGLFGGQKKAPSSPKLSQRPESLRTSTLPAGEDWRSSKESARPPQASVESLGTGTASAPLASPRKSAEATPPALPPRQSLIDDLSTTLPLRPSEVSDDENALPTPPASVRDSVASLSQTRESHEEMPGKTTDRLTANIPETMPMTALPEQQEGPRKRDFAALDEQETRVAIELMFAAIQELYTLSSAWNIRRTLLNAAKNYLLRPGNPSLLSIQELLQSSMLDANLSDDALSQHIRKMRENGLPTEEELAAWPPPPSAEEKEKLRAKARKLLVTKGMPQALTSVMGTAASSEALGRLFDALQVTRVSRGFMFAILLQAVRALTH